MSSANTLTFGQVSQDPFDIQGSSVRGKIDPAWNHFMEGRDDQEKKNYTCIYCQKVFKGGGINRMNQHLAGIRCAIAPCKKVPYDVKFQIGEYLKGIAEKKKETRQLHIDLSRDEGNKEEDDEDDFEEIQSGGSRSGNGSGTRLPPTQGDPSSRKRKGDPSLTNYFALRTTPGAQPSVKSAFASKELVKKVDMTIAMWMYDACIPLNAVNSIYFQPMIDAITSSGSGYKGPNYHSLRVHLLRDAKKEVTLLLDKMRSFWVETGCTIMADGWTDTRRRTLINFLVYCPRGMSFVKSIDASDVIKDATTLFNLFDEIVDWVGPNNVVHLVIDNASNFVAAGRKLCEKYSTVSWSPCAAHCVNLSLKDIGKLPNVASIARRGSKITVFIYNHIALLSWLRKRPDWTEIVSPGPTRFATTFIALKSLLDHKHDLQALVTSKYYVDLKLAKDRKAKDVVSIIMDNLF